MRPLYSAVASILLAIWMFVSLAVAGTIYVTIRTAVGNEDFWQLERSLGGFTVHLTKNASMDVLWFQMLVVIPVLILMSVPAIWMIRRYRE